MLRVMMVLGVLVLVPAAIVFWRMRDRTVVDQAAANGNRSAASRVIGTSTEGDGGPAPSGRLAGSGQAAEPPSGSSPAQR